MTPDVLGVVVAYLKDHPDIGGAGVKVQTVGGQRPGPWVRVTLLADPPTDGGIADVHVAALVQFDCYAGAEPVNNTAPNASALSRLARASIRDMPHAAHDEAVVTGAESSSAYLPDDSGEPALERFVLTSTIWMRSA